MYIRKTLGRIASMFAIVLTSLLFGVSTGDKESQAQGQPNIVLIVADDLGYGDLNISPYNENHDDEIDTPNIAALADEGVRLSSFYVPSPVCTPSRAALLTGQYPVEAGMVKVIWPSEPHGLDSSTVTLAEALRDKNYATGVIGKWHLGDEPGNLPTDHGFDYYYGMPYSNDMDKPVLMSSEAEPIEYPNQATLTTNYTNEAIDFISDHEDEPFFLYIPHTAPHVPLYLRIPMKSSTCSDHAVHCRSEATPASTLYSQVVDMGKGESTFRRDSPCRLSR